MTTLFEQRLAKLDLSNLKLSDKINRLTIKNQAVWFHESRSIHLSHKLLFPTLKAMLPNFKGNGRDLSDIGNQLYDHITNSKNDQFNVERVDIYQDGNGKLAVLFQCQNGIKPKKFNVD